MRIFSTHLHGYFRGCFYLVSVASGLVLASSASADPAWWPKDTPQTKPGTVVNDYQPVTSGQAKNMAYQAMLALDAALQPFGFPSGGAGEEIKQRVDSWKNASGGWVKPENAQMLNQGQLKAIAKPFYDRLAQLRLWPRGYQFSFGNVQTFNSQQRVQIAAPIPSTLEEEQWNHFPRYPWKFWAASTFWAQNNRSALFIQPANIGQLKQVFNFDPAALLASTSYTVNGQSWTFMNGGQPRDTDGDGTSDLVEFWLGFDPGNSASKPAQTNPYATDQTVSSGISEAAASRFLMQGTWGPSWEAISHVRTKGFAAWIDEQVDETHPTYGFRPTNQRIQNIPWRDGQGSMRWSNVWNVWDTSSSQEAAITPRLQPTPQSSYEASRDAALSFFPATYGGGNAPQQALIAANVTSRYYAAGGGHGGIWGSGGLSDYLYELHAPTLAKTPAQLTETEKEAAKAPWSAASNTLLATSFYGLLDSQWQMTGVVNGDTVTRPYADYDGPTTANANSSKYIEYAAAEPTTSRTQSWRLLRNAADPHERGPYLDAAFPKRGIEPYMFYLHWRKMVLDRPLWQAAVNNGWMSKGHTNNPSRVLPWPYQIGAVWASNAWRTSDEIIAGLDDAWLHRALFDPDQLRQRVAWALSQILVVSDYGAFAYERTGTPGMAHYYDMLNDHAFRNYKDLLTSVTFHPLMGAWLTYVDSVGAQDVNDATTHPDENYAREIMQLFSLGLHELRDDATPKLDHAGNRLFTYSQEDVRQLARVFTGLVKRGGKPYVLPMQMASYNGAAYSHDVRSKHFLGKSFAAKVGGHTAASAEAEVRDAVAWIATRPSVAPYICRQLIQHLTSSNPSPAYVRRVVGVWRANESAPDQLGRVVKSILLDTEARAADTALASPITGRMKDPMLRLLNVMRAFNAGRDYSNGQFDLTLATQHPLHAPAWSWDHYIADAQHLYRDFQQYPFLSPSVFSFYAPGFSPAGDVFNSKLLGPEYQLLNSATAASFAGRLWRDTDFRNPLVLATATADGVPTVPGSGAPLKQGELILNFLNNTAAGGLPYFRPSGTSTTQQGYVPDLRIEGFNTFRYADAEYEQSLRLFYHLPYTTPNLLSATTGLDLRSKALRLRFNTASGLQGTELALTATQRDSTNGVPSTEAEAFLDRLNVLMCGGRMTGPARAKLLFILTSAVNAGDHSHFMSQGASDGWRRERAAIQLLLTLPESVIVR